MLEMSINVGERKAKRTRALSNAGISSVARSWTKFIVLWTLCPLYELFLNKNVFVNILWTFQKESWTFCKLWFDPSKDKYHIYWSQSSAVVMAKLTQITCNIRVVASNCQDKTGPGAWVWQGYRWHWKSTFWHSHFICIYAKFVPCKCDVIRVSSSVSSIKTKPKNCLHTKTVRALVKVKEGVKMSGGAWCFPHPRG